MTCRANLRLQRIGFLLRNALAHARGPSMPLRLVRLYLRSRFAGLAAGLLVSAATLTWFSLAQSNDPDFTRLLLTVMPLVPAVVIGASARSPFGEVERTVSQWLPGLRFIHLTGLLACAGLALAIAGAERSAGEMTPVLLRNLVGYTRGSRSLEPILLASTAPGFCRSPTGLSRTC